MLLCDCRSPGCSRPTSPQSDSEVMRINQDAVVQTHLTGDRLILLDNVLWKWGEIPETTPHKTTVRRLSSKATRTPLGITDSVTDHLSPKLTTPPTADAVVEQTSEQTVSMILEPVDCDSEKAVGESKPVVDTNSSQSVVGSSSTVDSQVAETSPETKKG